MHELTEKDIEKISSDIDQQGLTYTLLKDELLDHICCDIEAEMEKGLSFNKAYRKVKGILGKKRIRQIQDETLSLISKKYRIMKRLMYVLGVTAPIILVIGLICKIMHWHGGGLLITLAIFLGGVVFLPLFVISRIRDTRRLNEPVPAGLYITGMLAGMITILGSLLKIMHMAGGGIMLTAGLFLTASVFLPMYAVVRIRKAKRDNETPDLKLYIVGVIAGILFIGSTLFKVMHFQGAGIILIVSWMAIVVIFLPILIINHLKEQEKQLKNFFVTILAVTFISLLMMSWLNSVGGNQMVMEGFIIHQNKMADQVIYLEQQNDRLLEAIMQPDSVESPAGIREFCADADNICDFINQSRMQMLLVRERNHEAIGEDGVIDYRAIIDKDNAQIAMEVMYNEKLADSRAMQFKSMIDAFQQEALALASDNELKLYIQEGPALDIPPSPTYPETVDADWAYHFFFHKSLVRTASNLTLFESIIRTIENGILTELVQEVTVEE